MTSHELHPKALQFKSVSCPKTPLAITPPMSSKCFCFVLNPILLHRACLSGKHFRAEVGLKYHLMRLSFLRHMVSPLTCLSSRPFYATDLCLVTPLPLPCRRRSPPPRSESPPEYPPSNFTPHYFFMSSEEQKFLALLHPADPQGHRSQPPGDQTEAVC